jgi:DNA-binding transcriptional regulator YhcF (GntR family)
MNTAVNNVIQFRPSEVSKSIVSNKKRGFTLVYKSLKDAPFYKNLERKSLWLHLLLQAAYEECTDSFNGNVITLQRGQLLGSVQAWANDCGVSYDSARRSIEYFESEGMITTCTKKGKSGFTVVTMVNFESYQDAKKQENSADYSANYDANYDADYKPAPHMGLSGVDAEYKTELSADYHAEASNNINNLKIIQGASACAETPITDHQTEQQNQEPDLEFASTEKPRATRTSKYQKVVDAYHRIIPEMAQVTDLTAGRKEKIKNFFSKYNLTFEDWEGYLTYISQNCRWMMESRPRNFGSNDESRWKKKNFDFLLTERCYLGVREGRYAE